jgi:hypothetical protein
MITAEIDLPDEIRERVGSVGLQSGLGHYASGGTKQMWWLTLFAKGEEKVGTPFRDANVHYTPLDREMTSVVSTEKMDDGELAYQAAVGMARSLGVPLIDLAGDTWPDCRMPGELDTPLAERLAKLRTPFRQDDALPTPDLVETREPDRLVVSWREAAGPAALAGLLILACVGILIAAVNFPGVLVALIVISPLIVFALRRARRGDWVAVELTRTEVLDPSRPQYPRTPLAALLAVRTAAVLGPGLDGATPIACHLELIFAERTRRARMSVAAGRRARWLIESFLDPSGKPE